MALYFKLTDAQWDGAGPSAISAALAAEMSRPLKTRKTVIFSHTSKDCSAVDQEDTSIFHFFWLTTVHP